MQQADPGQDLLLASCLVWMAQAAMLIPQLNRCCVAHDAARMLSALQADGGLQQ